MKYNGKNLNYIFGLNKSPDNGKTRRNEPIVIDKNVITSCCPETAPGVAFKLLELLTTKEQMENVKTAMGS